MPRSGMVATAVEWLRQLGIIQPDTPQQRLRAERTVPAQTVVVAPPVPERTPELSTDGDNSATSGDEQPVEPAPAVVVEHQVPVADTTPVPAVAVTPAPQAVAAPNVQFPADVSQLDRRARRRLGRLAVEHAETVLDREQLALAQDIETAVDNQLTREDTNPVHATPSLLARVWTWLSANRVFLGVAALEGVGGVVVVLTQLGFYRDLTGLDIPLAGHVIKVWLAMPFVNEGFTWAYGAMATWSVHAKTGGAAKYVRRMWMSAAFTATVNIVHNVQHLGEPTTGIVVGLFSLALPGLWHSFVGMTSALVSGRSAEDIKAAVRARVLHPWISLRTDRIQDLMRCDRTTAWDLAVVATVKQVCEELAKRKDDLLDGLIPGVTAIEDHRQPKVRKRPAPKTTVQADEPQPAELKPSKPNTEPADGADVIDLNQRTERPEWLTDELAATAKKAMFAYLDRRPEANGVELDHFGIRWLGTSPNYGRGVRRDWLKERGIDPSTAAVAAGKG